jgi:hypothetical protein
MRVFFTMSKLFVATEFPPDAPGGGPAVVRQMLQGFPGEVHWWSCRGSVLGSSFMVTRGTSLQSTRSSGLSFLLSGFHSCPPGKLMPAKKLPRIRAFLMEHLWAPRAARSLRQAIESVKPDYVWVIPHDWSIIPIWRVMKERGSRDKGGELSVHVTIQDFPDCHGHGKLWGEDRARRMARMQEQIYAEADSADATSHPMLQELEDRTGRRGLQILHQGLEPEDFAFLESLVRDLSSVIRHPLSVIKIAYAGTILCEPEFALFVNLLESIIQQRTTNNEPRTPLLELHLYGAHSYADRPWFRPWIIEHGNLPERELLTELRGCDWGFIPMSLENKDPRYNRFSFPTKFITYLAAGIPIISIGHPECSVMKMAMRYETGLEITSSHSLVTVTTQILSDHHIIQAFRLNMMKCANAHFNAAELRQSLWSSWGPGKAGC